MILRSKNQASRFGFFNSKDSIITKIKLTLRIKIEILMEYISKEVGRPAMEFLLLLNQLLYKNPNVQITRDFIAKKISMSTRTVSRVLVILENAGYIKVIRYKTREGMNGVNTYSLTTFFWETMERLNFERTLKVAHSADANASTKNIIPPLPSKDSSLTKQKTVDNSPIFDDIPIPDF